MKIVRKLGIAFAVSAAAGIGVLGISAPAHADTSWPTSVVR